MTQGMNANTPWEYQPALPAALIATDSASLVCSTISSTSSLCGALWITRHHPHFNTANGKAVGDECAQASGASRDQHPGDHDAVPVLT